MSLNFNTERVKDKGACWQDGKASPMLESLVWSALQVGLGDLTAKNIAEWRFRLAVIHAIGSDLFMHPSGVEESFRMVLDALPKFVGLHTNVGEETRSSFFRKVAHILTDVANHVVQAEAKKPHPVTTG